MPSVVMGSAEMTALVLLFGTAMAVAIIGRAAYRAIRDRDGARAREALAAAAILSLAAVFAFHEQRPRPTRLVEPPAAAPAPQAERVSREVYLRRAEQQAAERRRRLALEDDQRRTRERQEREQAMAQIQPGEAN